MAYKNIQDKSNYNKQYYLAHKEKIKNDARSYYINNKENILKKVSKYRRKHRDEYLEYFKAYRKKNYNLLKKKRGVNCNSYINQRKKYHSDEEYRKKLITRTKTYNKYKNQRKKCFICGSSKNLQFHHIGKKYHRDKYDIICRDCHYHKHGEIFLKKIGGLKDEK
jgi:hypothetical protein